MKSYFKPWDPQPKSEKILHDNSLELMRLLKWMTRCTKIDGPADTDLYIIGPQYMKAARKLIADIEGRTKTRALLLAALISAGSMAGIPLAHAAQAPELDPGRHQTGPAPCTRLLWVGGYRSFAQGGHCPEAQTGKKPKKKPGYTDKDTQLERRQARELAEQERKADREAKKAKHEQDRLDREAKKDAEAETRRLEKERREAEREAREDKQAKQDHDRDCRGLGLPAGCSLLNPGNGPQPRGRNQRARR